jgi:uncharacterized membrane protein YphA (DoxX/SURF4 family)
MAERLSFGSDLFLCAIFAWAGVAKVARPEIWRGDLKGYWLWPPVRRLAFAGLPWIELGAALCLVGAAPRMGAAIAIALMGVFSAAIVRAWYKQSDNRIGCGCFGGARLYDFRLLLLRNTAIAAMGVLVLWQHPERPFHLSGEALIALSAGLTAGAVVWVFWHVRHRTGEDQEMETAGEPLISDRQ